VLTQLIAENGDEITGGSEVINGKGAEKGEKEKLSCKCVA
jgi:hypothetical protein